MSDDEEEVEEIGEVRRVKCAGECVRRDEKDWRGDDVCRLGGCGDDGVGDSDSDSDSEDYNFIKHDILLLSSPSMTRKQTVKPDTFYPYL